MEKKEGNAAAGRWEASPDGVIVLPAGSAVWQQQHPVQHHRQQREREREREREQEQLEEMFPEPPEKVFYKTKLCEKFMSTGRCSFEDGCTFAHGHAELRPPLPVPAAALGRRRAPEFGNNNGGYYTAGKICFEFRDRGACHFGDRCTFAHASADMRYNGGLKLMDPAARWSATPPARSFSPGPSSGARGYAPAAAAKAPLPPAPPAGAAQDDVKVSRLELLSRKKLRGVYGDWPEGL